MRSTITFFDENIIELSLYNKIKEKNTFYLHFQLSQIDHAISLFNELIEAMNHLEKNKTLKILLSCSGGLTTSLFAYELNEGAKAISLDYEFEAVAYNELINVGPDYDVILLAPQISYKHVEVESALRHRLIIDIPPQIFASYNVGEMLDVIKEQLYNYKLREKDPLDLKLEKNINNSHSILTIGVIRHRDIVRIGYRIYYHNQILLDNEVLKHKISIHDITDIIDTVLVNHTINKIGIALPGIINNGVTDAFNDGFDKINVKDIIQSKFNIPTLIINDVNTMSVGHYVTQSESENITFTFQPRGHVYGGAGSIINGQLHNGYKGLSGEVKFLVDEPNRLITEQSDVLKTVTHTMTSIIATLSPSLIIYYCDLIPDPQILVNMIAEKIPKEYIPTICKTIHLKDYMLLGIMVLCETTME